MTRELIDIPIEAIAFARIPAVDRDRWPDTTYRLYVRGVPGGCIAGYTDVLVVKIPGLGWYLVDRRDGGSLVNTWNEAGLGQTHYHPTRAQAAAELHLCERGIPENVRAHLEGLAKTPCSDCNGEGRLPDKTGGGHHRCRACQGSGVAS